jgi:hypothetical protein
MAARGELGLRPQEQAAMFELLASDPDPEVAEAAAARRSAAPEPAVTDSGAKAQETEEQSTTVERINAMTPGQKLQLAMRGSREERGVLIRDSNRLIALAVLSSPKITESEVENIAKMTNVSEDILRVISQTRAWMKNYAIVAALARNSKTPIAVSLNILPRLIERDVRGLTTDRNIPDVVRTAARKRLTPSK